MSKFKNIVELFETFLIKNECYDEFIKNIHKFNHYKTIENFIDSELNNISISCVNQECKRLIDRAFNWSKSGEGMHYWYVVSMAWYHFYDNNKTTLEPAVGKKFVSLW